MKGKDAASASSLREECQRLRDKVQELQRDNSANQAKLLMSAFGSSGTSSLLGSSAMASAPANEVCEELQERTTQLEREVSTLTNENLKLKYENQDLQLQLESQIALTQPGTQEATQRLMEEEIGAKVAQLMEQKTEEVDFVRS